MSPGFDNEVAATDALDLVTDATPEEMKGFIENADFTFSKFGFVKVKFEESNEQNERLSAVAPLSAQKDNTITTSTTDSEIRGILPNPLRKLKSSI